MVDNITLDAGSGGATVKTDDDGTAHWQYSKLAFGGDGTQTRVTATVGLPTELLAGTASIGTLAANSGVDIGDVDVLTCGTITPGTAASSLGKAEDAVHASGDVGVMSLAVRNDTLAALAGTDGDYAPFQVNATGALYIQEGSALDVSAATVTVDLGANNDVINAGTFAVQEDGAALTALQLIDDAIYTDDGDWTATTSKHALVGGLYQSTPGSITDGDTGPLRLDANGAVHINDGGNSITIDGTVTANLSTTDNAVLDQLELNTSFGDNTGAGTESGALRVTLANDSTGVLSIDDNGGSITIDGTVTANLSATDNAVLDTIDSVLDTINAKLVTGTVIGDVNLGATDNAVLDSIVTNTTGLAGTVSGSELQVDVVASLPAGTNAIGDVGLSGARTSGGTTSYRNLDVDETEDAVKASAGQIYWMHAMNTTASALYLKFYDATVATVVVGTTVPVHTFMVPTAGDTNGAGFNLAIPNGIAFATAITVACTTGLADADTGAPGANALVLNAGYA